MSQAPKARMTGAQRREQLIRVGRQVFADKGVASSTVEEIATVAGVTKPVVYEHFGGKEGLYAVVVDREMRDLIARIGDVLQSGERGRPMLTRSALAMLTYVEESPDGFRVLAHDSPSWHGDGGIGSLIAEIGERVEGVLADDFAAHSVDPQYAPIYSQMVVGMFAFTGEWWLEQDSGISRDVLAAHLVNLLWNGFTGLEAEPPLKLEHSGSPED